MSIQYNKSEMDFSNAKLISAGEESLKRFCRQKEENFPNAMYIWPFGCTRFHFFRLFTLCENIKSAEIAFLCDNLFDVWLNGVQIANDTKHLKLTDVTKYLKNGENNLHIRGYQSGSDESFSSAITGGIRIYYADGCVEEILTDGGFKQVKLVDFWENTEPENFETETVGRSWADSLFFPRMEALTGIHMDASGVTDEKAYAELLSGMAQGNIPADVLFKASLTREQEQSLLDCGALIDLAPLIEENMPNLSALLSAHPDWKQVISLKDGRIASLPLLNTAH